MKTNKKLIEVALPLEAINIASAREKSIRHGHPSTLHLWWARRPLAAARSVIFAQMVDDPSAHPDIFKDEKAQEKERQRLFGIITELVKWESTTNEKVLQQARDEIWQSWRYTCAQNADHPRAKELFDRHKLPAFHDPFAGGGALPLEAQRLGLEAYASDLNPVAVLINKAMIEIPPKFAGKPPVNPEARRNMGHSGSWKGAEGLAEDVRHYGTWMRGEAEKRIAHLYPKIEITSEITKDRLDLTPFLGKKLTAIAWIWARTVKSPNPAFADVDVPLVSTFMLSTRVGKEAYVAPVVEGHGYRFTVKAGKPKDAEAAEIGTKIARAGFCCLMSQVPISGDYIKEEGKAGRMGARLMAIVAEAPGGRVYLTPTPDHEAIARQAKPVWKPDVLISGTTQYMGVKPYGMEQFSQLFTDRQLVALTTFSDLVQEARDLVKQDATAASTPSRIKRLEDGAGDADAYADAVSVFLAFIVDKGANMWSSLCFWMNDRGAMRETYARQVIPMVWDFAEANPFSTSGGNFNLFLDKIVMAIATTPASLPASAQAADAASQTISSGKIVSTDPPYYDNVPYADISDFFYVWLRRSLKPVFPNLFATVAVPKTEELVAFAYRHRDKKAAKEFFLEGMTRSMRRLAELAHPAFPVTIYYAFRQSETGDDDGTSSTGWETFLEAVIRAGFALTGTWPMRTEQTAALKTTRNALASSIVLVCRRPSTDPPTATRREFVSVLKAELPSALKYLQRCNTAPVDLAQAAIGPGMAVYTRYAKVLDAEGKPLSVRQALALINQTLDEALAEQEGDFDSDTRWALAWFEQSGFTEGEYGVAETLSKAKNTSVSGMVDAGIIAAGHGKVRLLRPNELPADWDPGTHKRLTAWEGVHQLIRALEGGGESAAAALVTKLGSQAETARELAYRLYILCERKKRASEALSYNALVQSWPEISRLAGESLRSMPQQPPLM
jgi:putative DNA methylase